MRRVLGAIACMGGITAGVAMTLSSSPSLVEAATPDAGVTDAGSASMSPYLTKAGQGTVLPPSVDDAEAFCALVLACLDIAMYPPAPDYQGCVQALMDQLTSPDAINASLSIRECGLRATSCKTLRACALKSADPKDCAGVAIGTKDPVGKCDLAGHAITCWNGKVLGVRDCGLANEICVAKGGKAECALAGGCPAGIKPEWTCAGTRMVKCDNNKFISIDCSVLNLTCVTNGGSAGCAPGSSASCSSTKISCSGDNAVGCVNGKEVKVACADQGMKCADPAKPGTERTVGVCEMPSGGTACDSKTYQAKCDGSAIKYCAHGAVRTYQCKSILANKCVMDKGSGPRCTG